MDAPSPPWPYTSPRCVRCPDLTQNSPPAYDLLGYFGQNTPDQLIGNQTSAAAKRFFGKWFVSDGVAELVNSATCGRSQAKYVMNGDTTDGGRRLPRVRDGQLLKLKLQRSNILGQRPLSACESNDGYSGLQTLAEICPRSAVRRGCVKTLQVI